MVGSCNVHSAQERCPRQLYRMSTIIYSGYHYRVADLGNITSIKLLVSRPSSLHPALRLL